MFDKLLLRISKHLEAASIPFMVIGGQAVLRYGEPRLTRDIDLTLGAGIDSFNIVQNCIRKARLQPLVKSPSDFVQSTNVFPLIDPKSGIRVDLIFSDTSYERQAIKRASRLKVGKKLIPFASVEDIIIQKIVSGRPRDIEDATSILLKNPVLDARYIIKWLKRFEKTLDIRIVRRFVSLKRQSRKVSRTK